ncbi:MAG: UDP-N-acetylmuramoyl-L-alanyl-D-glutamate--2,6-diaminopimelate ligase [Lachnospiraceae bacterium]|nr:UDP-N-acetylmuramoyl-L-alanyl-D-glutamate--2,6-diaminopimelate ligase [Candidatus Minthocola equi]
MILKAMLSGIDDALLQGSLDVSCCDVIIDSRKELAGAAFVCIAGSMTNTHDFAKDVAAAGASAIIISQDIEMPEGVTVVRVKDTRLALAHMSAAHFGYPSRKMKVIGITGTKGKTTATHMLYAILNAAGKKAGLIGTNGVTFGDVHYPTRNTTPESYELQQRFAEMVDAGCEYVVMEVSSQGIMMHRTAGIDFEIGVFTNITPDHIGPNEHASFEEYLATKARLFTLCKKGIVNADDPHYEEMIAGHTCEMHTFSRSGCGDFSATDIKNVHTDSYMGMEFTYHGSSEYKVSVGIPGIFNIDNALAAIGVADLLGIEPSAICEGLRKIRVNGRMELVHVSNHCSIIIDYAHNGVSARSMLSVLTEYHPKRLVVVFGCGGNRDPHRRYEMGEAVGSVADLAIITEDNSRYEDPLDIIKDIHIGFDKTDGRSIDIPDRREAIRYSIEHSAQGALIAIIGKGHEDYQETRGVRTHLLDSEEAEKVLADLGWN